MSTCPACGEAVVTGWAFCEACGAPASSAATDDAAASASKRSRRRQLTAEPTVAAGDSVTELPDSAEPDPTEAILALPVSDVAADPAPTSASEATPRRRGPSGRRVLLGLGALVVLVALVLTALNILGTRDRLDRTRTQLASTEATLKATKGELDTTKTDLGKAREDLAARTSERDKLQGDLNLATNNLADARGKVELQAAAIDDLSDCLDGIALALVDMANGFVESAVNELLAVEAVCERAAEHV